MEACRKKEGAGMHNGLYKKILHSSAPAYYRYFSSMLTTKAPILLKNGFWGMFHEARTDFSMLLDLIFMLIVGAGYWSIDTKLAKHQ